MSQEKSLQPQVPVSEMPERGGARVFVLAVVMGITGAVVASVYLALLNWGQDFLWRDLPHQLSWASVPLWYALALTLAAAVLVALAYRLPGRTGGSPLTGLHFDIGYRELASVVVASLATLVLGISLGPEAPLIACGTAVGALLVRRGPPDAQRFAMLLGGAAAIGAIFGNPFITAFLFLEFTAIGVMPAATLVPVLVSLGTGYLVMTGVGSYTGLGTHELSVPGLAQVDRLVPGDLAWGLVVAAVAAVLVLLARGLGWVALGLAGRWRWAVLLGTGAVTAVVAVAATAWSGLPIDTVLFSGETGLSALLGAASAGSLILVTVARMIAYGLALGAGFRGGPVFPAVAIGVGVGAGSALLAGPEHQSPLVVAGVAACVAAALRVSFTAGLVAMLITSTAGPVTAPMAIIGAVVGLLLRLASDRAFPSTVPTAHPAPEPQPAPA